MSDRQPNGYFTFVLLSQTGDADVLDSFEQSLEAELEAAGRDAARYATEQPGLAALAGYYQRFYAGIRSAFVERYGRDVVGQFRRLGQLGPLDRPTSAAAPGRVGGATRRSTGSSRSVGRPAAATSSGARRGSGCPSAPTVRP